MMTRIWLTIVLLQLISLKLEAQQDSLLNPVDLTTAEKDSIDPYQSLILRIDSSYFTGWKFRPCILPLELDTISLSYLFIPKSYAFVSHYNEEGAETDIKEGDARILFHGGFGGMPDFNSKGDKEFQKKYRVEFFSQGCLRSGEYEDEEGYNQVIFDYLDKKYGKAWRYELRDDAIGFNVPSSIVEAAPTLASPLALQIANQDKSGVQSGKQDPETSIWWYILPTSGFALLLSLYFIKRKKD